MESCFIDGFCERIVEVQSVIEKADEDGMLVGESLYEELGAAYLEFMGGFFEMKGSPETMEMAKKAIRDAENDPAIRAVLSNLGKMAVQSELGKRAGKREDDKENDRNDCCGEQSF